MSSKSDDTLRYATRNLTGNRETDIAFLTAQITSERFDAQVTEVLRRILACLSFSKSSVQAA